MNYFVSFFFVSVMALAAGTIAILRQRRKKKRGEDIHLFI